MGGSLLGAHAPPQQQHLNRNVVGNPPRQTLNGSGIGHDSKGHFRQLKLNMIGCDDEITGHNQLESAADSQAVDCRNNGFIKAPHLSQASKAPRQVGVRLPPGIELLVTLIKRLQVPASGKDLLTRGRDQPHPQVGIITQHDYSLVDSATELEIDCIHLGPVEGDLKHRATALDPYFLTSVAHRLPLVVSLWPLNSRPDFGLPKAPGPGPPTDQNNPGSGTIWHSLAEGNMIRQLKMSDGRSLEPRIDV